MSNKYAKAYTEVLEVLNYFSDEEYSKIPEEKIKYFKDNMDKDYIFTINPEMNLSLQNISIEANAILIVLFRDYFATEEQKKTLIKLLNKNQEKTDEIKRAKYNPNNVFNKKNTEKYKDIKNNESEMVEYKETFINRFISFIKGLFKGGDI